MYIAPKIIPIKTANINWLKFICANPNIIAETIIANIFPYFLEKSIKAFLKNNSSNIAGIKAIVTIYKIAVRKLNLSAVINSTTL